MASGSVHDPPKHWTYGHIWEAFTIMTQVSCVVRLLMNTLKYIVFQNARVFIRFRFTVSAIRARWSTTSSGDWKRWRRMPSIFSSFCKWIICCGSLRGRETERQPAGKGTGLPKFLFQWGQNCTSFTNQTLSCLATPNQTACYTTSRLLLIHQPSKKKAFQDLVCNAVCLSKYLMRQQVPTSLPSVFLYICLTWEWMQLNHLKDTSFAHVKALWWASW